MKDNHSSHHIFGDMGILICTSPNHGLEVMVCGSSNKVRDNLEG